MAEIITCPACQRRLQLPASYFGQTVQCPQCAHAFIADPIAQREGATEAKGDSRKSNRGYADERETDDFVPRMHRSGSPHRGGLILALGIISLVAFFPTSIICGPIAWTMANNDLLAMATGKMDRSGEGMVQAGRVLGMISTLLAVALAVIICLLAMLAGRR
jgi:hypothetical protein